MSSPGLPPLLKHTLQLVQTLYRQPGAWDLSVPAPGLDTSERRQDEADPLVSRTAGLGRLEGRGAPTTVSRAPSPRMGGKKTGRLLTVRGTVAPCQHLLQRWTPLLSASQRPLSSTQSP